jgi:hypothetical protein
VCTLHAGGGCGCFQSGVQRKCWLTTGAIRACKFVAMFVRNGEGIMNATRTTGKLIAPESVSDLQQREATERRRGGLDLEPAAMYARRPASLVACSHCIRFLSCKPPFAFTHELL